MAGTGVCLKVKGQKWLQNESQLYRPEFWCLLKQLFFVVVFFHFPN